MSYDLRLAVKVDGTDLYAVVNRPEYDNPTYNLRDIFVLATGWNYNQGKFYPCVSVMENIARGAAELTNSPLKYARYEPTGGWGDAEFAGRVLKSILECIEITKEDIPLEHLYIAW